MNLETTRISPWQFLFSVTCFIQSSSLLSSFFASILCQDSWLAIVFATIVCTPVLVIYLLIARAFPGLNLIQINEKVFGRIGGSIVSVLYIWFFLNLTALNARDLSGFVGKVLMLQTPKALILVVFLFVCAWAVFYGLEVVTRYSVVFSLVSFIVLIISIVFTLNIMSMEHFLPILDQPLKTYVQGTHIVATIPFGELVVFLMIIPYVDAPSKKVNRYFLGGFGLGSLMMLLIIFRDTAVLGNALNLFSLPSFETLRMVSLSPALSRMEILFAVALTILLFFKVSLLFYATILAIAQLFNLESYRILLFPCGAIILAQAMSIFDSVAEHIYYGQGPSPFFWLLFELFLPLLTLITISIRKRVDKRKAVPA